MGMCPGHESNFLQWLECHSGLAAWMQGIGAIIALVAIGTPLFVDQLHTRQARSRPIRALHILAVTATELIKEDVGISNNSETTQARSIDISATKWRVLELTLIRFPILEMSKAQHVRLVLRLSDAVAAAASAASSVYSAVESAPTADEAEAALKLLRFNEVELKRILMEIENELVL